MDATRYLDFAESLGYRPSIVGPEDPSVRIHVRDIQETTRELDFQEPTLELNPLLEGPVRDFQFSGPGDVHVECYRAGQELFFSGEILSQVVGRCGRCAESFEFTLRTPVSFVLVPRGGRWAEEDFDAASVDVGIYEGEEVDLSPTLREQMLLALPTQPLCSTDCRGLCSRCGANLNEGSCGCPSEAGDPRLAVLRHLKVTH